jgi:hypothetical protein
MADSCNPARARRIGTPALASVYIWRENSITSSSVTFGASRLASQAGVSGPAFISAARMSTGVIPVVSS